MERRTYRSNGWKRFYPHLFKLLQKTIESPSIQRRVSSTLSRGGRGNNTTTQKIMKLLFSLINNRIIKKEHFLEELNYTYLNEEGRRAFLAEYQKKLDTTINNTRLKRNISYQRLIRIECFKLVKHILGEKAYRGLRLR